MRFTVACLLVLSCAGSAIDGDGNPPELAGGADSNGAGAYASAGRGGRAAAGAAAGAATGDAGDSPGGTHTGDAGNGGEGGGADVVGGATTGGLGGEPSIAGAGGDAGAAPSSFGGAAGADAHGGTSGNAGAPAGGTGEPVGGNAGADAGAGAGGSPACECSAGPCCDGCHFRPSSHYCGEVARDARCTGDDVPSCEGATRRIELDYWNLFCNGDSSECTRWALHTKYVSQECSDGKVCINDACQACPTQ